MRQDVLPLGIEFTHLGRARVAPDRFDVASITVNGVPSQPAAIRAAFAAGEYLDLSEDERLSRPAFEQFVAGFSAGSDAVTSGPATRADLGYEEFVLGPDGVVEEPPRRHRPPLGIAVLHGVGLGPAAVSPLRRVELADTMRRVPGVRLVAQRRVAVAPDTLLPLAGGLPGVGDRASETEVRQAVAARGGPPGATLVVSAHEARQVS
jgi:hypothetical protein